MGDIIILSTNMTKMRIHEGRRHRPDTTDDMAKLDEDKSSLFIALINISESPSQITFSKPNSFAKQIVVRAVNTSTISTEVGNGINCVKAAITRL